MTKNLRSRLGIRSHIDRSESSREMPRFCSSKTRPNSLLSGGDISPATMLKPDGQALARAQRAGQHVHGVGELRGEGLQPPLAPPEEPEDGQAGHEQRQARQQQLVGPQDQPQQRPARGQDRARCRPVGAR